jgi:RHS repeat-associated protein
MSKGDCGKQFCITYRAKVPFTFKGTTYRQGMVFGTDDPCEVGAWIDAGKKAFRAATGKDPPSVKTDSEGGMRAIFRACARQAPTLPADAFKELLSVPLAQDSSGAPPSDAPPGEETAESLEAPSEEPIAEVGVENPPELPDYAKSVEGVADPQDVMKRIEEMRANGLSEDEIAEKFRKNEPADGEPSESHSADLNTDGCTSGDPVLLSTGQFDYRVIDVNLPSVGFPLRFERIHRSGPRYFGPLGFNWDHNYNQYLRPLSNGCVAHWTGQIQEHVYTPAVSSGADLEPPFGVHRRLRRVSGTNPGESERWELEEALGIKRVFEPLAGGVGAPRLPLVRIEDRHGNAHILDYDSTGRLARVRDRENRSIQFRYGGCDLLEQIEDHTGRRWSFLHDEAAEHLVCTQSPDGGEVQYAYDEGHPDSNLRHNIVRICDGGRVAVENRYSYDLGPDYGRVVLQYLGGVRLLYSYRQIQDVFPIAENVDVPARQTEVRRECDALRVYTFNFRGELLDERLRLLRDGTARVLAYAYRYDRAGNLTLRMEPDGIVLVLEHDAEAADPRARGNLLRMSLRPSPLSPGPTRTISQSRYEPRYQLRAEARDETGSITRFVYDFDVDPSGTGRLVRVEYPSATLADGTVQAAVEHFTCNSSGRWTERFTAAGHRHVRSYHPSGNAGAGLLAEEIIDADGAAIRQLYEYDAAGRLMRRIDGRGNATDFEYDPVDRIIRTQAPLVDSEPARPELRYVYDHSGLLIREEAPRGAYEDSALQGDAIVTEHHYDDHGWRIETTVGVGSSSPRRFRFSRDQDGRIAAIEDAIGRLRSFRYDERGLILEEIAASGDPDERRILHRYDLGGRRTATITAGREHRFEYDRYGRLKKTTRPNGSVEELEYGPNDVVLRRRTTGHPSSTEPPRVLAESVFEYDERSRVRRSTTLSFTDDPTTAANLTSQILNDPDGRAARIIDHTGATWDYEYDGAGSVTHVTDPIGNRQICSFDAAGNLDFITFEEKMPGGTMRTFVTRRTFDGRNNRRSEIDPLGNVTQWTYDNRGQLVSRIDPLGTERRYARGVEGELLVREQDDAGTVHAHRYVREAMWRLIGVVDPAGQTTTFELSVLDEVRAIVFPDGRRIVRDYHPTGELAREVHPDGKTLTIEVDVNAHTQTWTMTAAPGELAASPQVFELDGMGRIVTAQSGSELVRRHYDSLGRLTSEERGSSEISYLYDDAARSLLRTRGSGRAERIHFDALGRIERINIEVPSPNEPTVSAGLELCRYDYEGPSRVALRRDGNGIVHERGFDAGGRVAKVEIRGSQGVVSSLQFVHDGAARRVVLVRQPAPLDNAFASYDGRSRLTAFRTGIAMPAPPTVSSQVEADAFLASVESMPGTADERFVVSDADETIRRDVTGTSTSAILVVPGPFGRMASVNGVSCVYDSRGNLVDDGVRTFEYDAFSRLVNVRRKSDATVLLNQAHDPFGRVISREDADGSVQFAYEGDRILTESSSSGEIVEHVPGVTPGETVCITRGAEQHWIHQDDKQSLLATTNAAGAVVDRYAFSAFGIPRIFSPGGSERPQPVSGVRPVFGGHSYYDAVRLFFTRSRAYDPVFGRFLQPDPFWPKDSASPYSYAGHNPINVIDPTGLCLPRPGSSGTGSGRDSGSGSEAGSGSGAGDGRGSGSGSGSGGEGESGSGSGNAGDGGGGGFGNYGRGLGTIGWGLAAVGFALLILSGPLGWLGALAGTMMLSSGIAGVGIGLAQIATAHTRTEQQDIELDRAVSTGTALSSGPGSLIGGTVAAATGNDVEKGAIIGGITEGVLTFGKAVGGIIRTEWQFSRLPKLSYNWKDTTLKVALQQTIPGAASRSRLNPLGNWMGRQIEWMELSHFFSRNSTRGFERLFNRPWNLRPVWATEHALMDPARYQFMSAAFKSAFPEGMTGLTRFQHLLPEWMRGAQQGASQMGLSGVLLDDDAETE